MAVILVEGPDRAGKTTECRRLMALPRTRPTVLVHFVAPPDMPGGEDRVLGEVARVYRLARENPDMDFVLDRGHVSVFAYAAMRGKTLCGAAATPHAMRAWERHNEVDNAVLMYCREPEHVLEYRDDRASTFTRPTQRETLLAARAELEAFDAFVGASRWECLAPGEQP